MNVDYIVISSNISEFILLVENYKIQNFNYMYSIKLNTFSIVLHLCKFFNLLCLQFCLFFIYIFNMFTLYELSFFAHRCLLVAA